MTDTARAHHFADADRRDVGTRIVHPAAHRRIQRQIHHAHQHLAGAGRTHRNTLCLPVAGFRQATRARSQQHLSIRDRTHRIFSCVE